jgi:hypothetical protein
MTGGGGVISAVHFGHVQSQPRRAATPSDQAMASSIGRRTMLSAMIAPYIGETSKIPAQSPMHRAFARALGACGSTQAPQQLQRTMTLVRASRAPHQMRAKTGLLA